MPLGCDIVSRRFEFLFLRKDPDLLLPPCAGRFKAFEDGLRNMMLFSPRHDVLAAANEAKMYVSLPIK
jgi:hypothetical protein